MKLFKKIYYWINKQKDLFFLRNFKSTQFKKINFKETEFEIEIKPNRGWVDNTIFLHGIHEPEILEVIDQYTDKESMFVDVGCNIGQHSVYVASKHSKNIVIAVDPIQENILSVIDSAIKNNLNNIETHQVLCGEKNADDIPFQQIAGSNDRSMRSERVTEDTNLIKMQTLDDIVGDRAVSFIKIDTEGYEQTVFAGAQKTIKKNKPVILFEFTPQVYKKLSQSNGLEILENLRELGYELFDINMPNKLLTNYDLYISNLLSRRSGIANIIAKP